ncbi:FadR/GntR family transcriptional regulator [Clostridium polynesiense]|uniref:FadR/GntR family transcriptional regulator n=1 Tax=Clostridium polynesiense TaxID=1325933 RepID=UPI00058CC162|nr:FadR/GntR family transcriptional regulator [Clostridium polynesiense]
MFKPIKNARVYEQVVEQIKLLIFKGIIKKGDKLPTERELAEQLQVSRTSVREALRALEVIGLIESRQGAGNYIRESFNGSLFEPLSTLFILDNGKAEDILEFRELLELQTVVLASERIDSEEAEEMKSILVALKASQDEEESILLDKKFHYYIAKASKNILILNILEVISQLIDEFIRDSRNKIYKAQKTWSNLNIHHEKILEALINGDSHQAFSAMKGHFDLIRKNFDEK